MAFRKHASASAWDLGFRLWDLVSEDPGLVLTLDSGLSSTLDFEPWTLDC